MSFESFEKYLTKQGSNGLKHSFYTVDKTELQYVKSKLVVPIELQKFYLSIGYGFMYDFTESYAINKIYDPMEFMKINLKLDYYEFDPTLDYINFEKGFIFFEIVEGNYLTIDKIENEGKNAIYYFDEKIANSLEEFLEEFDNDPDYLDKI